MIKGWKHLIITYKDGTTSLKPKVDWTDDEALGNSKALNVILNGVNKKFTSHGNSATSMFITIKAPPEKNVFTTYGPL